MRVLLFVNLIILREANTPYDVYCKLIENFYRIISQIEYASIIGILMYAMHYTRSNIAFALCKLSRYTSNPSMEYWKEISRVFEYLK